MVVAVAWLATRAPTEKKASSKTSRGPEKPITSSGWAPSRQKMTPCSAVDMINSDTPIRSCVFSPEDTSTAQLLAAGPHPTNQNPCLPSSPPKVMAGDRAAK